MPDPVLTYEGVTLGSTLDDLIAMAAAKGWRQNATTPAGDQTVTVFTTPDHPVKRYKLGYEGGKLVNIEIQFRAPDPARLALRDQFAVKRQVKDIWYLTDSGRQVLASVDASGAEMRALHAAKVRDQREVQSMFKFTIDAPQ